ncbi:hypothetical protein COJ48_19490 [Bacillus cereus]|nr:hypothetical protein COJ48_19490 [Bacillus cereus]PGP88952.1 hypothetical protein CN997_01415 [Bacillus cereus]
MSKFSKAFNEYFYARGDNDPKKEVWRYGKYVSLERLYGYDDYVYYRPRRQMAGTVIGLSLIGSGYCLYKGGSYLKAKYDKRKTDKENL